MSLFDLLQRAGSGLRSAANTAADNLMPAPLDAGLLLDDGDVQRARRSGLLSLGASMLADSGAAGPGQYTPSFGEALGHGMQAAQAGYKGTLGDLREQHVAGIQTRQQLTAYSARPRIAAMLNPQDGDTPESMMQRRVQAYQEAIATNNLDIAKALEPSIKNAQGFAKPDIMTVDNGGQNVVLDKLTGKPVVTYNKTPAPMSPYERTSLHLQGVGLENTLNNSAFTHEQGLSQDYTRDMAPVTQAAHAYQNVTASAQAALNGDGPAQQAFVSAVIKLMHPNAIVRPGEVARYEDGRPIKDAVSAMWNHRIGGGGQLANNQIVSLLHIANGSATEWQRTRDVIQKDYRTRAGKWNVNADNILTDPWEGINLYGTTPAPTSGAAGGAGNAANVRGFLNH